MQLFPQSTLALAFLCCGWIATTATAEEATKKSPPGKSYFRSFTGQRPPELKSTAEHWVNRMAGRLTLAQLKGKTVWLQFNF